MTTCHLIVARWLDEREKGKRRGGKKLKRKIHIAKQVACYPCLVSKEMIRNICNSPSIKKKLWIAISSGKIWWSGSQSAKRTRIRPTIDRITRCSWASTTQFGVASLKKPEKSTTRWLTSTKTSASTSGCISCMTFETVDETIISEGNSLLEKRLDADCATSGISSMAQWHGDRRREYDGAASTARPSWSTPHLETSVVVLLDGRPRGIVNELTTGQRNSKIRHCIIFLNWHVFLVMIRKCFTAYIDPDFVRCDFGAINVMVARSIGRKRASADFSLIKYY